MAINEWNPISFGLTLGLNLFDWFIPNGCYSFMFVLFFNNPSALFYIVWIHGMEAKQYEVI
jgi:hypothetical protein